MCVTNARSAVCADAANVVTSAAAVLQRGRPHRPAGFSRGGVPRRRRRRRTVSIGRHKHAQHVAIVVEPATDRPQPERHVQPPAPVRRSASDGRSTTALPIVPAAWCCCRAGSKRSNARQPFRIDGFREMVVHACSQAGIAVLVEGIDGHREDGQLVADALANAPGRFESVQPGHLHVHQRQVIGGRHSQLHCLGSVAGHVNQQVAPAEQLQRHRLVDRVVLGQQQPLAGVQAPAPLFGFADVHRRGCRPWRTRAEAAHQAIEQGRGRDRLHQHRVDLGGARLRQKMFIVEGGDDGMRRHAVAKQVAQALQRLDAVQRRRAPVDQHHVLRAPGSHFGVDLGQALALPGVMAAAQDDVGGADDGIHRRPDFVAHVGQKGGRGHGCSLRLVA